MKKINGILNKKLKKIREEELEKEENDMKNFNSRVPPGSPVFRRVSDEINLNKPKKYVNWNAEVKG